MNRRWLALLGVLALAACSSSSPQEAQSSATGTGAPRYRYRPDENLYPVGAIPDAVVHDAQRNKDLALSIEYPTRGGPYPVIIFSHGYGSSKDAYTPLTEYWAGHGYICIKPDHADAGALRPILAKMREERRAEREKEAQEGRRAKRNAAPPREEPVAESLWASMTPADWTNRARDISLVIDSLTMLQQKYPELAGRIDVSKIAVAGHSLGAFTTMLVAGTEDFKTTPPIHVTDPRVKAGLALSPQGIGQAQGLTAESWKGVSIPMMYMTGTLDRGAGDNGDPKWRQDPFTYSPPGDKFFLSFTGARHSTFSGGMRDIEDSDIPVRGMSGAYPADPWGQNGSYQAPRRTSGTSNAFMSERRIFGQVKTISTAFFDAYLKGEKQGLDYMKPGGTLDYLKSPDLAIERK